MKATAWKKALQTVFLTVFQTPNCFRCLVLYTVYSSSLAVLYLSHSNKNSNVMQYNVQKVAIAMPCNWGCLTSRQSFWSLITRPIMHQRVKFKHIRAMRGWVINDSANFPYPSFRGGRGGGPSSTPRRSVDGTAPNSERPIIGVPKSPNALHTSD